MEQASERVVLPFTFIFKREDGVWTGLACEVDVCSCGDSLEDAREKLKEAVELYVTYLLEQGRQHEIERRVPVEALREFCADTAPGDLRWEGMALVMDLRPSPSGGVFLQSLFLPTDCATLVGVGTS
jgi:predicted RNase H-like HicB family nuclease